MTFVRLHKDNLRTEGARNENMFKLTLVNLLTLVLIAVAPISGLRIDLSPGHGTLKVGVLGFSLGEVNFLGGLGVCQCYASLDNLESVVRKRRSELLYNFNLQYEAAVSNKGFLS